MSHGPAKDGLKSCKLSEKEREKPEGDTWLKVPLFGDRGKPGFVLGFYLEDLEIGHNREL
jgi:hypothetical protein